MYESSEPAINKLQKTDANDSKVSNESCNNENMSSKREEKAQRKQKSQMLYKLDRKPIGRHTRGELS